MKSCMLLLLTLLLLGCASTKEHKVIKFNQKEEVFNYAISDFVKNCSLYKKDSVFSVSFHDTICGYVLVKADSTSSYTHKFVVDTVYENIIAVRISGGGSKWLHGRYKKDKLPSRYAEINGKLFYFTDYDYELSEEAVSVFNRYNLLEDDDDGFKIMAENSIDDSKKGAHYYYCRNNIIKYKRVTTNIGMGHYKPPKLKCD